MSGMNPIMLDFADTIETEHLYIRKPLPGDGYEVNLAIIETLDDLQRWMPWALNVPSAAATEENIRLAHLDFLARKELRFHGYHKQTGELVFCSGFQRIDWSIRKFEIGYWIRKKYSGQGLVTEGVKGLETFAITQLSANRLEIRCDARNEPSARVAERLGYTLEGVLRLDALDVSGAYLRHTKVFAKVRGIEFA